MSASIPTTAQIYAAQSYSILADCIRSGQVPEVDVPGILAADPDFAAWYRAKFGA